MSITTAHVDKRIPPRNSGSPAAAGTLSEQESELALIRGGETASHSESIVFRMSRGGRGILNIETPLQTLVDKTS